jgi:PAS domain S-box-containing protein
LRTKAVTSSDLIFDHGLWRETRAKPLSRLLAAVLLLISLACPLPGYADGNTPIFVLHSYSQEYPWTKRQHEGFMRKLDAAASGTIAASVEYLDTKRVPYTAAYADFFAGYLAQKYSGLEPKLIYVTDDNALLFALTHLARIFPNAPVFFSGINDYDMKQKIDPRHVTGVFENKEIAPNLNLMRHLAPGMRDILVVGDESETFQTIRHEIIAELVRQPDIQAKFLSSGRIESLVASLRDRNERVVFLTTLGAMADAGGHTLTLPETVAAIVQAGRFIVVSMEDVYLYPGVLGGYVTSGYKQGSVAAEMGARYLAGAAVAAIKPIEASPNEYIFDGAELEKLRLTLPSEIAAHATILNPVPTFYERHQALIVRVLYLLALLFVVSIAASQYLMMRKNRQLSRASLAQRESEERYRTLIDWTPEAIVVHRNGTLLYANPAAVKMIGADSVQDVLGKPILDWVHPDYRAIVLARVRDVSDRGLATPLIEEKFVKLDGTPIDAEAQSTAILYDGEPAILVAMRDITERKQAEAVRASLEVQLRESQKMEALGTLAGGVAHDFNNALAAITGNVELARQDVGPGHQALVSLEEIGKASRRAKDLVQQILAFGRRQKLERKATSLALVVVESARLIRATLPGNVSLKVDCQADTPAVLADATQVKQILLNLCGNALDAVQDQGRPGLIEVRLTAYDCPQSQARGALRPGRYACLTVKDNGSGMEEATRSRIFDPFFTTKPVGKGTGLGLSVVHTIAQAHVASIEVESTPGRGSSFHIFFPATDLPLQMEAAPAADTVAVEGQGKHILYVDDEEAIIFLMTRLLERQGYRVSGYTDPRAALAAVRADPAQFDLAVTDYNMPGMSGLDVAQALSEICPGLPVVLASGYITEDLRARAPAAGVRELIYKPNTVDDLCEAVARFANAQRGRPHPASGR